MFHYHAFAFLQLIVGRSCADVEHLRSQAFEFLEFQRTVVKRRRQTEAIFHKIHLAREVAAIHRAALRQSDVALVNDGQEVLGEIVEETEGTHARLTAVEVAAVVFDS